MVINMVVIKTMKETGIRKEGGLTMQNKINATKLFIASLILMLLIVPQLSYADWGVGIHFGSPGYHHDDHRFYRWHDHPHWGLHLHFLPVGYITINVGWHRYYYYDGLYYTFVGGDYVLVNPPVGAYVQVIPPDFQAVIINGRTYYTDNGVYYILTRYHGYKVVAAPVVYAPPQVIVTQPYGNGGQGAFPVNIPNNSGGYISVIIKKSGNGFVGPQGEFYPQFPTVEQLRVMYNK